MRLSDACAVYLSPVVVRLVLGVTFLWAGAGKVFVTDTYGPQQAALLAEYGLVPAPAGTTPAPAEGEALAPAGPAIHATSFLQADAPTGAPADPGADAATEAVATPRERPTFSPQFSADAFPPETRLAKWHNLVLLMHAQAYPSPRTFVRTTAAGTEERLENVEPRFELVPSWVVRRADGGAAQWPGWLAMTAGWGELIAGGLLIIGLLGRVSALVLAGTMATAMWLTTLGPALMYGQTLWGFVPAPVADWSASSVQILTWDNPAGYASFGWQLILFASSLAVVLAGSGGLSVDSFLFGGGRGRRDDD